MMKDEECKEILVRKKRDHSWQGCLNHTFSGSFVHVWDLLVGF